MSGISDGITILNGIPILLRDSHLAEVNFTLNNPQFTSIPRIKYMFYVRFVRNSIQNSSNNSTVGSNIDWNNGISFTVKNIDRPKISYDIQTLNQYNKKRLIQTHVDYQAISIKFHDTVDNTALLMFQEYFSYYYGDTRNTTTTAWRADQTIGTFVDDAGAWGFSPPIGQNASQTYFFDHLEVYEVYGGNYSQYNLVNPKIISFEPDNLDYANSNTSAEISISLLYEGIIYVTNSTPLSQNQSLISLMRLDQSSFFECENSNQSINNSPTLTGLNDLGQATNQYNLSSILSNFQTSAPNIEQGGQSVNLGSAFSGQYNSTINNNFSLQNSNNSTPGAINGSNVPITTTSSLVNSSTIGSDEFSPPSNTGFSFASDTSNNPNLRGIEGLV